MSSNNEAIININLNAFKYSAINLKEIQLNKQNESIFRLSSANLISRPNYLVPNRQEFNFLTSIKCLNCQVEILNDKSCFNYLKLPENDLDELADNFFCHLHDHNHNKCHVEDLTNALNPLRDNKQLRKSILGSLTLLILNSNHLCPDSVKKENLDLKCSKCLFTLGYQRKNSTDFYLWKSSVVLNDSFVSDAFYLGSQLGQGKYLLESKKCPNILFLWVLNDKALFKHYKLEEAKCDLELNLELVKKCSYKILIKEKDDNEIKKLKNDCNVNHILVSKNQFENFVKYMNKLNSQLSESLRKSNDFYFSIISD